MRAGEGVGGIAVGGGEGKIIYLSWFFYCLFFSLFVSFFFSFIVLLRSLHSPPLSVFFNMLFIRIFTFSVFYYRMTLCFLHELYFSLYPPRVLFISPHKRNANTRTRERPLFQALFFALSFIIFNGAASCEYLHCFRCFVLCYPFNTSLFIQK